MTLLTARLQEEEGFGVTAKSAPFRIKQCASMNVLVRARVPPCPSFWTSVIMDIWNSAAVRDWAGGITHVSEILCSPERCWLRRRLNERGRLCCCEILYSREGASAKVLQPLSPAEGKEGKKEKGMTSNTWGHFLISNLSKTDTPIIQPGFRPREGSANAKQLAIFPIVTMQPFIKEFFFLFWVQWGPPPSFCFPFFSLLS